ncbi:MAG: 1-deoxy-D-xylulose-5-phosphate reductoisomerase [Bacteroidales bacterium]|nr:1-deoxy-D-xylulose-5-phosphate reductoisomerase [Bacteroidales bacterium]
MKRRIAILGSTGSIGTQALNVIEKHPDHFEVEVLTAQKNAELLIRQAIHFKPSVVVINHDKYYTQVKEALEGHDIKVYTGDESIAQVVEMVSIDTVLIALVGFAGLMPTINAIKANKNIALANKESLVVAGDLIKKHLKDSKASIIPVDSEHSAIFQCLAGEDIQTVEKIILTASGGPFRNLSLDDLKNVSREDALNHPNWNMGNKITIDSASLINKGLEVIEAKWLFGLTSDQIEVVIHPQSIIHSLVQFYDGSIKAQMSLPDMRIPIQYALGYPERMQADFKRFSFLDYPELTFEAPDVKKFRNLALAFKAMEQGGNMPCILNAANEIAVQAFLQNQIKFLDMPDVIEKCMERVEYNENPGINDYLSTDVETRELAHFLIGQMDK